jgi:hypothetical protein
LSAICEEIIVKLFDLAIVIVAALLAYFFGIRKLLKERELSRQESIISRQQNELFRKIELYKQLIKDLMDASQLNNSKEKQKEEFVEKLNRHSMGLLQFAPDHVYREYMKLIANWRKGEPITNVLEFMLTLRKELIPDTTIKADEMYTLTGVS